MRCSRWAKIGVGGMAMVLAGLAGCLQLDSHKEAGSGILVSRGDGSGSGSACLARHGRD